MGYKDTERWFQLNKNQTINDAHSIDVYDSLIEAKINQEKHIICTVHVS